MSIKLIFSFLVLSILSIYFAFLNPEEAHVRVTQSIAFHVPQIVFLLGAILIGTIASSFIYWTYGLKRSMGFRSIINRYERENAERIERDRSFQQGENALMSGNFDKAVQQFEKILNRSPKHTDSLRALGDIKRKQGKLDEAVKLHKQAVQFSPGDIPAQHALAEDYIEAGLAEPAVQILQNILNQDREAVTAQIKMRDFYASQQSWEQAYLTQKAILTKIRETSLLKEEQNRLGEFICERALQLFKEGKSDQAIEKFKRALRESHDYIPAYVALGDLYLQIDDTKAAVKTWKAGFDNTRSPICLQRIEHYYSDPKHFKDVVKMYQSAIQTAVGDDQETLKLILGILFLEKGEPQETINTLKNGGSSSPEGSLIQRLLLAKAYEANSSTEEAEKASAEIFQTIRQTVWDRSSHYRDNILEEWEKALTHN